MGTPLGPKYVLYNYLDPLGIILLISDYWKALPRERG